MKEFLGVVEGKRQTKERLDLIEKAYRQSPNELKREIQAVQERIDELVNSNKDLLMGPEEKEEEEEIKDEIQN